MTDKGRALTKRGNECRTTTRSQQLTETLPLALDEREAQVCLELPERPMAKSWPPTGPGLLPDKPHLQPGDFRLPNSRDACPDFLSRCCPITRQSELKPHLQNHNLNLAFAAASSDASPRLGIQRFTETRTRATSTRRMRGPTFDVRGVLRLAARRPLDGGVRWLTVEHALRRLQLLLHGRQVCHRHPIAEPRETQVVCQPSRLPPHQCTHRA